MFFMGDAEGGAMAVGSILVVGVAVLGSLTVLPAVLAKLGDRVHRSRLPLLRRMKREERDSRIWGFVLGHVLRRPLVALVAGVAVLAALAFPRSACTPRSPAWTTSRAQFPVLKTYDRIAAAFPARAPRRGRRHPGRRRPRPAVQAGHRRARAAGARRRRSRRRPSEPPSDARSQRRLPLVGDGSERAVAVAHPQLRSDVVPARSPRHGSPVPSAARRPDVDGNDNLSRTRRSCSASC
jgi:RND superfamily putative drug exporter